MRNMAKASRAGRELRLIARRAWLGPAQLVFEALDDLDRGWVDAAGGREVKRDEVAQHHAPQQAGGAGFALGLDPDDVLGGRLDQLRRELGPLALAGVLVGVLEEDGREAAADGPGVPADDLVVVHLG